MTENTAKIIDFDAFRATRKLQAPANATQAASTPASATPGFVWPLYWVYFPNVYVSSGY